jgi:hypothetical protein
MKRPRADVPPNRGKWNLKHHTIMQKQENIKENITKQNNRENPRTHRRRVSRLANTDSLLCCLLISACRWLVVVHVGVEPEGPWCVWGESGDSAQPRTKNKKPPTKEKERQGGGNDNTDESSPFYCMSFYLIVICLSTCVVVAWRCWWVKGAPVHTQEKRKKQQTIIITQ